MSRTALALTILIPCVVLAVPAWLLMRAVNHRIAQRREREAAVESAKWDAEMARVRDALKRD